MAVTRPIPYSGGVPGGATTVVLFDSMRGVNFPVPANVQNGYATRDMRRVRLVVYTDQNATFLIDWSAPGGAQVRTLNGTATPPAGEPIVAGVPFEKDVLILPGRILIKVVTGSAPSIFEVAMDGDLEPGLAQ